MSIVLVGSTSGSITLQEPAVAGTTVLTLPATSGTILTTASSGQSIPKAALPTGSVLQVVSQTQTGAQGTTSSTSFVATNVSLSITPLFATSKIFVQLNSQVYTNTTNTVFFTLYRGASDLGPSQGFAGASTNNNYATIGISYLDSPATTSSTNYTIYFRVTSGSAGMSDGNCGLTFTLMEIAA